MSLEKRSGRSEAIPKIRARYGPIEVQHQALEKRTGGVRLLGSFSCVLLFLCGHGLCNVHLRRCLPPVHQGREFDPFDSTYNSKTEE
jgi:hypothetical protein